MALAIGTNWFHKILNLILCICLHGLGLLHKIVTSFSVSVSGLCMISHNFYCTVFLLSLIDDSLISGIYITVVIHTQVVQWLRFAFSNGLNRLDVSQPSPEDGNRSNVSNVLVSSF
jgi:hypothetical protein